MASYPAPPDQGRRLSEALANATASGRLGIDRQRLGLERSNLDMLIERHRAEQAARDRQLDISERAQRLADEREYVDPSEYQPFLPPSMRSDVPSGRMRRTTFEAMLPGWRGESERRRAMEQGGTVAGKLRDLYGETTEGPVAEGMYGPGSPTRTVPKRIETLAQLLETIGATEKTLPLIEKETGPEETITVGAGQRVIGKRSGKTVAEGGAPKGTQETRTVGGRQVRLVYDDAGNETNRVDLGPAEEKPPTQETRTVGGRQVRLVYDDAGNETNRVDLGPAEEKPPTQASAYIEAVNKLEEAEATYKDPKHSEILKWQKRVDRLKPMVIAEGGTVTGPTGTVSVSGPPKTQALPGEQTANLGDLKTTVNLLDDIEKNFDPKFVGPAAGRMGSLRQATGIRATTAESDFRAMLSQVENTLLNARSGKAVTPQEYERIKRELPQATDPEVVFKAKLAKARELIRETIANREAEFKARGFRGGQGEPPAPDKTRGVSADGPKPSMRFNPKTGKLERIP